MPLEVIPPNDRFPSGWSSAGIVAPGGAHGTRSPARMFLTLFLPVRDEWERRLQAGGFVDFDDMILQAAELVEAERWASPYRLVMVDEMPNGR